MRSFEMILVALCITSFLNIGMIGSLLGAVGSAHDKADVLKTLDYMSGYSFQTFEAMTKVENNAMEMSAYTLFKNLVFEISYSYGSEYAYYDSAQEVFAVQFKPCLLRYYYMKSGDYNNVELKTDIEIAESKFCEELAATCDSVGAASGALYILAFLAAILVFAGQIYRARIVDDPKYWAAVLGGEIFILLCVCIGSVIFPIVCTNPLVDEVQKIYDEVYGDVVGMALNFDSGLAFGYVLTGAVVACMISITNIGLTFCSKPEGSGMYTVEHGGVRGSNPLARQDGNRSLEMHEIYGRKSRG